MQPPAVETLGVSATLFLGACLIFSRPRRGTPIQDLAIWGASMGLGALTLATAAAVDERWITAVVLVGALGTISHEVLVSSCLPRPFLALGSVALFHHFAAPWWQAALLLAAVLTAALAVGPRVRRRLPKGPQRNNSNVLAADPSRPASLLVGHVPTGMLPPRASPAGRLDRDLRSSYFAAGPNRWREDLAVLLALAAAAFLAAPELLRGWDRAHVAAETASGSPPRAEAPWAVAFVVGLFAVTLLWGLWRSTRGSPLSLRSTEP